MSLNTDHPIRGGIGFADAADPVRAILTIGQIDDPHCANTLPNLIDGQFEVDRFNVQRAGRILTLTGGDLGFAGFPTKPTFEHLQDGENLRQFVVLRLDGLDTAVANARLMNYRSAVRGSGNTPLTTLASNKFQFFSCISVQRMTANHVG